MTTLRAHTAAVVAALEGAGLVVGLGARPDTTSSKWAVVHTMGRTEPTSVADSHGDFLYTCQVVAVGQGPEQAEWVADRARTALTAPLSVTGRTWLGVAHEGGPPLSRDDDVHPPLFWLSETYRFRTGPA